MICTRLTGFALAVALLLSPTADACSCIQPPPPKQALKDSKAVFSGKVVKSEVAGRRFVTFTIEIEKTWKGTKGKSVKVTTASHGASCGYGFKVGQKYIVYCYQVKETDGYPAGLMTGLCTRTKPLSSAKEDLDALGPGMAPK